MYTFPQKSVGFSTLYYVVEVTIKIIKAVPVNIKKKYTENNKNDSSKKSDGNKL